jgi:hypothetical protein
MQEANPESAFLGPRIWSKPISLPVSDEEDEPDFSVMNIEVTEAFPEDNFGHKFLGLALASWYALGRFLMKGYALSLCVGAN